MKEVEGLLLEATRLLASSRQSVILEKSMAVDDEAEFKRLDELVRRIDAFLWVNGNEANPGRTWPHCFIKN